MRVGQRPVGDYVERAGGAAEQAPARRTPVTRDQIHDAIARALEQTRGTKPSGGLVDVLTAQACLETASGDRMFNYNFGGIKGQSPSGATAVLTTHEVVNGQQVTIRDGFRAYASLDEGARDYVKVVQTRFSSAMAPAERGDVAGFAAALKKSGYYTASESDYAKGLQAMLAGSASVHPAGARTLGLADALASARASAAFSGGARGPAGPTADDVTRVRDALDADRFSGSFGAPRHHARVESDEDEDDA